jgi:hypothetical protein
VLEGRTLPATVTWTAPAGGAWETPTNWSTGSRPGPADDVVINNLNTGAVITHTNDQTFIHRLTTNITNAATLSVSGGSLTMLAPSSLDSHMILSFTGGSMGGPGTLDLNGVLQWSNGVFFGTGVTNARGGIVSTSGKDETDGHVLNNFGTATFGGTGFLDAFNGSVINNEPGAVFEVRNDQRFQSFTGPVANFNNMGTFRRLSSSGTANIDWIVNNTGTFDVQTGTVTLPFGGVSSGSFTVASGATLNFTGGYHNLTAASSVSGAGAVVFSGGTTEVRGTYNVTTSTSSTGGTVNFLGTITSVGSALTISGNATANFVGNSFSVGTLNLSGGTLLGVGTVTVTGTMNWTGGTMADTGATTLGSSGTLAISGGNGKTLDARTLNLTGGASATWIGPGGLAFFNGAVLNNRAGATFTVQTDTGLSTTGALSAFNNAGSFIQSNSTGTTTIGTPFFNSGTVNVQTGTLVLGLGGVSSGSFTAQVTATLNFAGGDHNLTAASTVGGGGTVMFSGGFTEVAGGYNVTGSTVITGGSVDYAGTITSVGTALTLGGFNNTVNFQGNSLSVGTFTLSSGTLYGIGDLAVTGLMTWTGGTMADTGSTTLTSSASLTISGTNFKVLDGRTLNITGGPTANSVWTGTGDLGLYNGAVINNMAAATFVVQNNQTFANSGVLGTFNNAGTFQKRVSTGTTTVNAVFNNSGTVDVQTGTLTLGVGGTTSGSLTVEIGTTLNLFGNVYYNFTAASSLGGAGTVVLAAGYSEVDGMYAVTGSTAITGGTTNFAGMVSSVGNTLTISGNTSANFVGNSFSVGTFNFSGGTLLGVGDIGVTGMMTWTGGTLADTGSTTLASGATLTISGSNGKALDGRTLNLTSGASAVWTGPGGIAFFNGAVLNNQAGATFTVQTDTGLSTSGALSAFNNAGSFIQSNSTGTTTIGTPFFNSGTVDVQTGTLSLALGGVSSGGFTAEVTATLAFSAGVHNLTAASSVNGGGTVVFSGGFTEVDGNYNVTGSTAITGGTVDFPGTITSVGTSLTLSGPSPVANFEGNSLSVIAFTFNGGTLVGVGDVAVTGQMTWTGGSMADTGSTTLAMGATLSISGNNFKVLDGRTLNLSSGVTTTFIGTGDFGLFDGAVINNQAGATFNVENNQAFTNSGDVGTINNAGTFRKLLSTGTTTIVAAFNNSGTTNVQTGALTLAVEGISTGSFTVAAGTGLTFAVYWYLLDTSSSVTGAGNVAFNQGPDSTVILGNYAITGATQVNINASVYFLANASTGSFTNAGTVIVGTGVTLAATGTYQQTGGTTYLTGATLTASAVNVLGGAVVASGDINGNVTNAGTFNLGNTFTPGALTIHGNYTQAASGVLNIKIGGLTAGTQFDQLNITGSASLNGTLNVGLIDGFFPNMGDNFAILTFASESGNFTTENGLILGGSPSRRFNPVFSATALTLQTVPN